MSPLPIIKTYIWRAMYDGETQLSPTSDIHTQQKMLVSLKQFVLNIEKWNVHQAQWCVDTSKPFIKNYKKKKKKKKEEEKNKKRFCFDLVSLFETQEDTAPQIYITS